MYMKYILHFEKHIIHRNLICGQNMSFLFITREYIDAPVEVPTQ